LAGGRTVIAEAHMINNWDAANNVPNTGEPDMEPVARYVEPVTPATADERQVRALAPNPDQLIMVAGGVTAVALGGAVGYWLGHGPGTPARRKVGRTARSIDTLLELAPIAVQLLGNPLVRTLAIRMVMRQIRGRLPS